MGRKKAVNLFPEYARSKKADVETMSQLVLAAKGDMTMKQFANKCGVNTSTISRIINMKTETVCSDEIILAISENAVPESGVTLEKLLAANGMVKLIPEKNEQMKRREEPDVDISEHEKAMKRYGVPISPYCLSSAKPHFPSFYLQYEPQFNLAEYETGLIDVGRQVIQNNLLLSGYSVELLKPDAKIWPYLQIPYGDFIIKTNALEDYKLDK